MNLLGLFCLSLINSIPSTQWSAIEADATSTVTWRPAITEVSNYDTIQITEDDHSINDLLNSTRNLGENILLKSPTLHKILTKVEVNTSSCDMEFLNTTSKVERSRSFIHVFYETFGTFSFKGIGVNFVKSIIRWDSFGVNIVLPISTNFPKYDRVLYYPKVGCRVGVAYPCTLRLSVTISLPTYVILAILQDKATASSRLLTTTSARPSPGKKKSTATLRNEDITTNSGSNSGSNVLTSSLAILKKKRAAADSVRRLGVQFTFTYDRVRGLRSMVGPQVAYLPGVKVMEWLKPAMLLLPTMVLFSFNMLTEGVYKLLVWCIYCVARKMQPFLVQHVLNQSHAAPAKGKTDAHTNTSSAKPPLVPSLSDMQFPHYQNTWDKLFSWIRTKTPSFACNLGYFTTTKDTSMGSNLVFELQPFFSLHKHLSRRKATPLFHYTSEETSATANRDAAATATTASVAQGRDLKDAHALPSGDHVGSKLGGAEDVRYDQQDTGDNANIQ